MKVKQFHFNSFYRSSEYKNAYNTVTSWINEEDIDVVSITEIADEHYNLTINVWYRESEFSVC